MRGREREREGGRREREGGRRERGGRGRYGERRTRGEGWSEGGEVSPQLHPAGDEGSIEEFSGQSVVGLGQSPAGPQ